VPESGLSDEELVNLLSERLQKQQPFDTQWVMPGKLVISDVNLGRLEPLTQFF
jgi:hypothetical protein